MNNTPLRRTVSRRSAVWAICGWLALLLPAFAAAGTVEVVFETFKVDNAGGNLNRYSITDADGNGYGVYLNTSDRRITIERRDRWAGRQLATSSARVPDPVLGNWYTLRLAIEDGQLTAQAYAGRVDPENATPAATANATDVTYDTFTQFNVNGGRVFDTDNIRVRVNDQVVLDEDFDGEDISHWQTLFNGQVDLAEDSAGGSVLRKSAYDDPNGGSTSIRWAVAAANFTGDGTDDSREAIYTLDLGRATPRVYGPFLQGQLTESGGGGIFDVARLPGGKQVLVSLFASRELVRIDVSDPKAPVITGRLELTYESPERDEEGNPVIYSVNPLDIAVSPNGSIAVVSGGLDSPYLAFIDLQTFSVKGVQRLQVQDATGALVDLSALACAIAADNQTVLCADYWSKVHAGTLSPSRDSLVNLQSLFLCGQVDPSDPTQCPGTQSFPVNLTISPNGQTAIVAVAFASVDNVPGGTYKPVGGLVNVLQIVSPGVVVPGNPFILDQLPVDDGLNVYGPGGNQSLAFGADGRAYLLTQPAEIITDPGAFTGEKRPNLLAELSVTGAGQVEILDPAVATLFSQGTVQMFGVDTLTLSADGSLVLASNPNAESDAGNRLTLFDTRTNNVKPIALREDALPTGVAFR